MFVRALTLTLALATSVFGQGLFNPPRPKVVATPTPPPAAPVPKPPRKRPVPKPDAPKPDAPATTATSYMPKVKAAFAARWNAELAPAAHDFVAGNVSVLFTLDGEGKLTAFKLTENTSNEAFAKFCEKFVRETPFEKPPVKALTDGALDIPFTFWIY